MLHSLVIKARAIVWSVFFCGVVLAGCADHAESAAFKNFTFTMPPSPTPTVTQQFRLHHLRTIPARGTSVRAPIAWSRAFSADASYPPAIAAIAGGIVISTGMRTIAFDQYGNELWQRNDIGSPLESSGGMLFAASRAGVVEIRPTDGKTLMRYGDCPRDLIQWIVPRAGHLLAACTVPSYGDASIAIWSYSGVMQHRSTFSGGAAYNAAWLPLDANHVWLTGGQSGALSHGMEAVADLRDGTVIAKLLDVDPAGLQGTAAFAAGLRYTPDGPTDILLHRIDLRGATDSVVATYPASPEETTVWASAYVSGPFVYVVSESRFYRYHYPSEGVPELLQRDVQGLPIFWRHYALIQVSSEVRLVDLVNDTSELIGNVKASGWMPFSSNAASLTAWRDPSGTSIFDFRDLSSVTVPVLCNRVRAIVAGRYDYALCEVGDSANRRVKIYGFENTNTRIDRCHRCHPLTRSI